MKQNNRKVIWLTGGSGSGKSTVANILKNRGFCIVDADLLSRGLLNVGKSAYNEVVECFGEEILQSNKEVNRRMLGDIVFSDKEKLSSLNRIMHKYIKKEIEDAVLGNENYVIDAPLLNTYGIKCDMTVAVIAPWEERVKRIMARDELSVEQAENRISSQVSDEEYKRAADIVICNSGNKNDLEKEIDGRLFH